MLGNVTYYNNVRGKSVLGNVNYCNNASGKSVLYIYSSRVLGSDKAKATPFCILECSAKLQLMHWEMDVNTVFTTPHGGKYKLCLM